MSCQLIMSSQLVLHFTLALISIHSADGRVDIKIQFSGESHKLLVLLREDVCKFRGTDQGHHNSCSNWSHSCKFLQVPPMRATSIVPLEEESNVNQLALVNFCFYNYPILYVNPTACNTCLLCKYQNCQKEYWTLRSHRLLEEQEFSFGSITCYILQACISWGKERLQIKLMAQSLQIQLCISYCLPLNLFAKAQHMSLMSSHALCNNQGKNILHRGRLSRHSVSFPTADSNKYH